MESVKVALKIVDNAKTYLPVLLVILDSSLMHLYVYRTAPMELTELTDFVTNAMLLVRYVQTVPLNNALNVLLDTH